MSIASIFLPKLVENYAYNKLTHPQVKKLRPHELEVLNTSVNQIYFFGTTKIQTYVWNGGSKSVLLIHGWEGQAGNFSDLIIALQRENFTIYTFDAPSHGFSEGGNTSLFEFTEVVAELIEFWDVNHLVSHSFGGVATTYALKSLPSRTIDKYVLLTTPDKFSERIDQVALQSGITQKVKHRLIKKMEKETGLPVDTLNVSKFVQEINVAEALIIHDRNDKVIPISQSENVAKHWDNCTLKIIEGTGHFRILRTRMVIDQVKKFLRG